MRRKLTVGSGVVALVVGVLAVGPSLASGTGGGGETIELTSTEIASNFLDLGATGPSQGDEIVFADTLSRDGKSVGEDGGTCTLTHVVSPHVVTFNCIDTLSLRGGQITVQGLVTFRETEDVPFTVAVTGGTGAYLGVGGDMVVTPVSETVDRLTLHLVR
jgi:hypothetical protein